MKPLVPDPILHLSQFLARRLVLRRRRIFPSRSPVGSPGIEEWFRQAGYIQRDPVNLDGSDQGGGSH